MQNLNFKKVVIALGAALVASAACAQDGTVSTSATIEPECAVTGVSLDLQKLTMINASTVAQSAVNDILDGTIRAICTNGTQNVKFIYTSANADSTDFQLRGADGTTVIKYSLHQDAGATLANKVTPAGTGAAHPGFNADGTAKVLPISVKVEAAAKQGKKVQSYSDTITVTTSFDA